MEGYVYVLFSPKNRKTYIGSTDNLNKRINDHVKGRVVSTKNRLPVRLIHSEKYKSLQEARFVEKYYKSCAGRIKLKEILKNKKI